MAYLVKALADSGKAATDLVAAILILIGGLLTFGAYVYRVFVRPEWTSGEALAVLWPFFAVGCLSLVLGWLVDRNHISVGKRNR